MARIDRTIKRLGGFLIGDSAEHGKDQIISDCFKFPHPEHNLVNQRIIDEALAFAQKNRYDNIRAELVTETAITIPQGIIGWRISHRRVVPFTDKVKDIFVCAS